MPLPGNLALLLTQHVIIYLLHLLVPNHGKGKNTPKEVRPSTTRGGKDLPSRQNFSPDVASAIVTKKKGKNITHHKT